MRLDKYNALMDRALERRRKLFGFQCSARRNQPRRAGAITVHCPPEKRAGTARWPITEIVIWRAAFALLSRCRRISPERSVSWKTRKHGRCGNLGAMSVARAVEQKE
jgi:hypothetical protein